MTCVLVTSPMACLLLVGCSNGGVDEVYRALCDDMASTRGMLHFISDQHEISIGEDIEAVAAAKARTLVGEEADRTTRKNVCYPAVDSLYGKVDAEIKKLEFGALLIARGKSDWSSTRNPLADSRVRTAFDLAHNAARMECEAADPQGAFVRMSEGLREYDRSLLQAFDACEAIGWERSRWDQANPVYQTL